MHYVSYIMVSRTCYIHVARWIHGLLSQCMLFTCVGEETASEYVKRRMLTTCVRIMLVKSLNWTDVDLYKIE